MTVKAPELSGVADRLAERVDATPLALGELLLTTLRELAVEQRAPRQALLDARPEGARRDVSPAGRGNLTWNAVLAVPISPKAGRSH
ncbi:MULTISPECIES: hypothetical protein [unclassified Streptomyces]|uniref:hypothetical protein n=1 Tax=unclassified Streptomyces TaxID=2593676 RepID=UPI00224DA4ED|nr:MULTISPECIES: hypothetical protein [unclassified Streptomyces]WSJ38243.1 hypothetical protein OG772_20995 [Streptomyces sp. NBC_01321]WSP64531.1 hypothetical protein OG466_23625 [Streptomyces sp. NBC_01240]